VAAHRIATALTRSKSTKASILRICILILLSLVPDRSVAFETFYDFLDI